MKIRYIFLFFFLAIFLLIIIFFIKTSTIGPTPPGLDLNVSESIYPDVAVFVLDRDGKEISSLDENEFFFLQQRGLPKGTIYGFRVVDLHGEVIMPVYETYTAKTSDWIEQNKYYQHMRPGNQTVELLIIKEGNGIVVARTKILVFNFRSIVNNTCSNLMNEPVVDENGWGREGKLVECVTNIAIEFNNVNVCNELNMFNLTFMISEECVKNYAVATKKISVCDNLGMPKSRGFCRAKVNNDWTECRNIKCDLSCAMENLKTQQDLCIQWYAIEHQNASLCNEINSTAYNMKEICFNITKEK